MRLQLSSIPTGPGLCTCGINPPRNAICLLSGEVLHHLNYEVFALQGKCCLLPGGSVAAAPQTGKPTSSSPHGLREEMAGLILPRARPFSPGPPIPEAPQPRGRQQVPPPHPLPKAGPGSRARWVAPEAVANGRCQRPQRSARGPVAVSLLPGRREGTPSPSVGVCAHEWQFNPAAVWCRVRVRGSLHVSTKCWGRVCREARFGFRVS